MEENVHHDDDERTGISLVEKESEDKGSEQVPVSEDTSGEEHLEQVTDESERLAESEAKPIEEGSEDEERTFAPTRKRLVLYIALLVIVIAGVVVVAVNAYLPGGRAKWSYHIKDLSLNAPATANGIVYIGNADNTIYALNTASGNLLWSAQPGNYTSSRTNSPVSITPVPTVSAGFVYTNSQNGYLYALHAMTGKTAWSFPVQAETGPVVSNGVVYIGSEDGVVYALNADNGYKLWSYKTDSAVTVAPVVSNGIIYITGHELYALNAASGEKLWQTQVDSSYAVAVANGSVYLSNVSGTLQAFDARNGTPQWQINQSKGFTSAPVVSGNLIYVYSFAGLFAFTSANGKQAWFNEMPGSISTPLVVDGTVYVSTENGSNQINAVNASTGAKQWFYQFSGQASSPTVSNGVVYVAVNDANVYALLPPG